MSCFFLGCVCFLLFTLFLHMFVSPHNPPSTPFHFLRTHLTGVTVNMSWQTKISRALHSPSVYNGPDNLTTEKLFGKMGQCNSIVTALYWKQLSWEGPSSLCLSRFQPLSLMSSSSTGMFELFRSFPIIPSFIIDQFKKPLKSLRVALPKLHAELSVCMYVCVCSLQPSGTLGPTLLHWH